MEGRSRSDARPGRPACEKNGKALVRSVGDAETVRARAPDFRERGGSAVSISARNRKRGRRRSAFSGLLAREEDDPSYLRVETAKNRLRLLSRSS